MRILVLLPFFFAASAAAQQVSDTSFHPKLGDPQFEAGKGPAVFLDEAHHNFHTVGGRYAPFCEVLRADGFTVRPNRKSFSAKTLAQCDVLVIANALNERNAQDWTLPTPSAFTEKEIAEVKKWVESGGSLFLVADHMPFAGAAAELSQAFGFVFRNGFVLQQHDGSDLFTTANGGLSDDPLTNGVGQVRTFTGQGFGCPPAAHPLILLDSAYLLYLPQAAWEFETNCETESAAGLVQLAYMPFGEGKIVVSGEAAMFSSQVAGNSKVGLTSEDAKDNLQLLRNLMKWLAAPSPAE